MSLYVVDVCLRTAFHLCVLYFMPLSLRCVVCWHTTFHICILYETLFVLTVAGRLGLEVTLEYC